MAVRRPRGRKGIKSGLSAETQREFRAAAKKLRAAGGVLDQEFEHGLFLIGEEIMADIKDAIPGKGVPVDEGVLRDSGRVLRGGTPASGRGFTRVGRSPLGGRHAPIELTFGGAAAPYALIQHEHLGYKHDIGEARYLVRGMERWRSTTSGAWAEMVARSQARLRAMSVKGGMRP